MIQTTVEKSFDMTQKLKYIIYVWPGWVIHSDDWNEWDISES